jgi:V/A-type H+-transporting ATPase subunit D
MPVRPPPGSAGRVWFAERIEVARRAAELLEHKQELLRRERRRLTELAARSERAWREQAAVADTWNARALVSGGRDELRRAAPAVGPARVHLRWVSQAGVTYPGAASVDLPAGRPPVTGPALAGAAEAGRRALDAAVRHAAATTARDRVDEELVATARRVRAVRDRWLSELEARSADLDLRLDELEREEVTRLRWCGDRSAVSSPETP